eukprot:gene263-886_t
MDKDIIFDAVDELDDSDDSEGDVEKEDKSKKHKRMLSDLSQIASIPNKRAALRNGPGIHVSEHSWSYKGKEGKDEKVKLNELLQAIPQSSSLGSVRKKIQKLEKSSKTLNTPLSKVQTEKIQRTIGYENVSKEISKWSSTVIQNREAEVLQFPLNAYEESKPTIKSAAINFKPKNSLEKEIAAVLKSSSSVIERNNQELTEQEEKALQAVDLQEAIERRKELQKMRALQSYYEKKCKRTRRIKSKKFRKVQRRIDEKKEAKNANESAEVEKSKVTNEIETNRALERAHLRHRNTSKWAKRVMAKENKSTQEKQSIHDQLRISRQLTEQKVNEENSSDGEDVDETSDSLLLLKKTNDDADNPWLLDGKNNLNKGSTCNVVGKKAGQSSNEKNIESSESEQSESGDEIEGGNEYQTNHDVVEERQIESTEHENEYDTEKHNKKQESVNKNERGDKDEFIATEKKALDIETFVINDNDFDFAKSKEQQSLIKEAFAHDNVVEEFADEKEKAKEERKPKSVDLSLPGWGEWAGAGIDNEKILKRKRRRFQKVEKKSTPSRDDKLSNVIINETRNERFAANQVSNVPFPYISRAQFERSIRQPIGKTWNTPSLSAKLVQPRVSTLIGTIIEPIKKPKVVKKQTQVKFNKDFLPNTKASRKN